HLALDFGTRHQRGDRIDDDDVYAARTNENLDDLERLFAVVRLRDQQVVEVDTQLLRVRGIERMLRIDERRHAASFLRFGNHLERQRRLAGRLRSKNLDDTASWHTAHAERVIDADGSGRNGVDRLNRALLTQTHD